MMAIRFSDAPRSRLKATMSFQSPKLHSSTLLMALIFHGTHTTSPIVPQANERSVFFLNPGEKEPNNDYTSGKCALCPFYTLSSFSLFRCSQPSPKYNYFFSSPKVLINKMNEMVDALNKEDL